MSLDFSASALSPATGFLGDIGNPLNHITWDSSRISEKPEDNDVELIENGVASTRRCDAHVEISDVDVVPLRHVAAGEVGLLLFFDSMNEV